MKKNYQKPQIEVVTVNLCQPLAGSKTSIDSVESDGIFSGTISGGSGGGRSRGADDWDDED